QVSARRTQIDPIAATAGHLPALALSQRTANPAETYMHTDTQANPTPSAQPDTHSSSSAAKLSATAPGQLRVIKRNGTVVPYDDSKVSVAMTKAFLAVEGGTAAASSRVHETMYNLTAQISSTFKRRMPSRGTVPIEAIQAQVEMSPH